MKRYLLSIYQPDGPAPDDEFLAPIMRDLAALNADMRAAGVWVFTAGLFPADTSTVVRVKDGDALVTDGPYLEGKEHVGGLWVIDAPDLDAALGWARRAAAATTPVVALNRAVAVAELDGPAAALALVDGVDLRDLHLFHAIRADLLRRLGRRGEAVAAYDAAIGLAGNAAERAFLTRRRAALATP